MKKVILYLLLFFTVASCVKPTSSSPGKIEKKTYVFSIKENDTLRIDKYDIPTAGMDKPCVIFVFGGSFMKGARDEGLNVNYLQKLAEMGYVAIGIDYRLGMKNIQGMDAATQADMVNLLMNSIFMAVEDLFDATKFVYAHAGEWGIDQTKIIANGSSAGAVTVLQAEYFICNKADLTQRLPEGFRYAGVIGFAGAIASEGNELNWSQKPAPIQLFHGDADRNVPFGKITYGDFGLFGSEYIAKQLKGMQLPYYFYETVNVAHETSETPMAGNLNDISTFIEKYIIRQEQLTIDVRQEEIGKPVLEKNFSLDDYIMYNYQ